MSTNDFGMFPCAIDSLTKLDDNWQTLIIKTQISLYESYLFSKTEEITEFENETYWPTEPYIKHLQLLNEQKEQIKKMLAHLQVLFDSIE